MNPHGKIFRLNTQLGARQANDRRQRIVSARIAQIVPTMDVRRINLHATVIAQFNCHLGAHLKHWDSNRGTSVDNGVLAKENYFPRRGSRNDFGHLTLRAVQGNWIWDWGFRVAHSVLLLPFDF